MAAQAAGQTLTPEQQAAMSAGAKAKAAAAYEASLPPFETVLKEQDHWTAALSAYQPLFHGGKILSINRAAAAKSRAAAADTIRQLADLKRDYAKYYIQGAMLRRSIALRLEALEAIGHPPRPREEARGRRHGRPVRPAARRSRRRRSDHGAGRRQREARHPAVALAQLSGSSDPQLPSDKLPDPPVPPAGPSSDVSGNPLLASIQANREAASSATWIKAGEFLPEIGAFGKYELHREALSAPRSVLDRGVRGTWTLFRGGTDAMNWKAARSQEAEAVAMHKEATSLLAVQQTRQYLSWTQARGKWERMASQEALAFENHRVAELRFQQGQGTSLDVRGRVAFAREGGPGTAGRLGESVERGPRGAVVGRTSGTISDRCGNNGGAR